MTRIMLIKTLSSAVLYFVIINALSAQNNSISPAIKPETVNLNALFTDRRETEKWLAQLHIPALGTGYIDKVGLKTISVYGRKQDGKPYALNTIFSIGSLTRSITALLALQLVNAGKWKLDDPIVNYLPAQEAAPDLLSRKLTIRHILNEQSGLKKQRKDYSSGLEFDFEPGTKYQYSEEAFEMLRKAIEQKAGRKIEDLASGSIFEPLGMSDTHFVSDSNLNDLNYAGSFRSTGDPKPDERSTNKTGNNGLLTTVHDYSIFLNFMLNGGGLDKSLFSQVITPTVNIHHHRALGLGWMIYEGVDGGMNAMVQVGEHAIAVILPNSKQALFIITNSDNGNAAYSNALRHFLGDAGQMIQELESQ